MSKLRRISGPFWALFTALSVAVTACGPDYGTAPTVTGISTAKGGNGGGPGGGGPAVDDTDPPGAPQDTTLDVVILGSGFDDGSVAEFTVNGVGTPKFRTNSTVFVSNSQLVANVTIALDADTTLYDVEVTTTRGKKGVGADLFQVITKGTPPGQFFGEPTVAHNAGFDLHVVDREGNDVRILLHDTIPNADQVWEVSWAPFGSGTTSDPWTIAFGTAQWRVYQVDVDTVEGQPRARNLRLMNIPEGGLDATWSPDGLELAITEWSTPNPPSQVWVVPAAGGSGEAVFPNLDDQGTVEWATWSPDGRWIVFRQDIDSPSGTLYAIRAVERATGDTVTLMTREEHEALAGTAFDRWGAALDFSNGSPMRLLYWAQINRRPGKKGNVFLTAYTYVMDVAEVGGRLQRTGDPVQLVVGSDASWSPDDSRIVVKDSGKLLIYELATGSVTTLLPSGAGDPDWRPF